MNIKKILLTSISVMLFAFSASSWASSIHLICRGGISGNNSLTYTANSSGTGDVTYFFTPFKGKKSDVKRDGSHLAPGECSWATDVLASKYNTLIYYTKGEQVYHQTDVWPILNADHSVTYQTRTAIVPGIQDDSKQKFLPSIDTLDNSIDALKGSILDDAMIFNFYVVIDQYDNLVLQ